MSLTARRLARQIAADYMTELRLPRPRSKPIVPLRQLARAAGLEVEYIDSGFPLEHEAGLFPRKMLQPSLFGDYTVQATKTPSFRQRFSVAHEIGHKMILIHLDGSSNSLSPEEEEEFCDEFAGRILLPDTILLTEIETRQPLRLDPSRMVEMSNRFRVSISCLMKRISDLALEGPVDLENAAFLAAPGLSAKQQANLAPRLMASCTPASWFLPPNKRLATLGAAGLLISFRSARPFRQLKLLDGLTIWYRKTWTKVRAKSEFSFLIFENSRTRHRFMLATFNVPPPPIEHQLTHYAGTAILESHRKEALLNGQVS